MTEGELRKAMDKADTVSSAICAEFIAAGRGYEKPSETRLLTDPLALRWKASAQVQGDLIAEGLRRMEYPF